MQTLIENIQSINLITLFLVIIFLYSFFQGIKKGMSRSAFQLSQAVQEIMINIVVIIISWKLTNWLSPMLQTWLVSMSIQIPSDDLNMLQKGYYILLSSIRDFTFIRFIFIFLIGYFIIQVMMMIVLGIILKIFETKRLINKKQKEKEIPKLISHLLGGAIGGIMGFGKVVLVVFILFIYVTLFPQAPYSSYIQSSIVYQNGTEKVLQPLSHNFVETTLPVIAKEAEDEYREVLQRKYEIIDYNISEDITEAAQVIVEDKESDEEKAKALYDWVGTRVQYNWEKVKLYEEDNIWLEQTPEDTFRSKQGVCIDFSRLYAVMARAIELDVKVVTGLGSDGRGGMGPHAWNEVYLSESGEWIPLDTTWVSSGGNWFNSKDFYETHIKDA
ncbi:transglutaminase domain-containing protein [Chengkuizengella axinellae]|uniref:Transglutaminase domain-containing protein n=1 Tax=Chengkuizengella axinellae TaxID=3064388 RepID=A0ABT9ITA0_9BACL|nr:transglutaminase domain-containing protein [Chengkuizengella sp. 2205SS18-9]MDP5272547.1 transglutaminase domain-containing protein [Chengkuizengella sp. 2205SS18-9]